MRCGEGLGACEEGIGSAPEELDITLYATSASFAFEPASPESNSPTQHRTGFAVPGQWQQNRETRRKQRV